MNAKLILDILDNQLVPADLAATLGPNGRRIAGRFCNLNVLEKMKLTNAVTDRTLSSDEMLDLRELIRRIEAMSENGIKTTASSLTKDEGEAYVHLFTSCVHALSEFPA